MSIARFSVRQVIFVNCLFGVLIIAGVLVYRELPVDVYPDVSLDEAWVQTVYPGASPEDVEQQVTRRVEHEMEDIVGVARVVSYSVQNLSNVFIKFHEDLSQLDFEASFQEVRTRLDRVTDLPEAAEKPLLTRLTLSEIWPLVQVVIMDEAGDDERLVREVARDLRDRLRRVSGVAKVKEVGLREPEIHVLLNRLALEQYNLSLTEVAAILAESNINIPGGYVETGKEEFALRAVGDAERPQDLGAICIKKSPVGDHVYLRDVARIAEGFDRELIRSRYMGRRCGLLYVAKAREADAVSVRNRVNDVLQRYASALAPPGIRVELFGDSTLMISNRINILKNNLALGLILVFMILWAVLGFRNSILALIGIPFSFLCAFMFLHFIDVSLNAVSVFALVLVSGMIVDDAIVVLENIYRHVHEGKPLVEAIIAGTEEVMWPVISAALTTVAAFLPLLIMPGVVGRFFSIIPKTVTVALVASLFECLLILPAHYLHWGSRRRSLRAEGAQPVGGSRLGGLDARLQRVYRSMLKPLLAYRYLCLLVFVSLGFCAYQARRTLAVELFPSDFPILVTTFDVGPKASLAQADAVCRKIFPLFDEFVEAGYANTTSSIVGMQWNEDNQMRQGPNLVQMWVELKQTTERNYDPQIIMDQIRQRLVQYAANHPEANIHNLKVWPVQDGPPIGKPIAIRVEHPDYTQAGRVSERIRQRLRQLQGVYDVVDNLDLGQRELRMSIKEDEASDFGLTFGEIFNTLGAANDGVIVGRFKDRERDEDLDIRVRYQEDFRSNVEQLLDMTIKTASGALVKLRQVANLTYAQGYATHYRFNGHRSVLITAAVDKTLTDAQRVNRIILREFGPLAEQDDQLEILAGGQFTETRESFQSLIHAGLIAITAIYLILTGQFKNFLHPFLILSAMAFGAIGTIIGLVVHGYLFSVATGVAMIGLMGIVVNDAILLVSFVNQRRARSSSLHKALIEASLVRLRPILLTTVTTVIGLLPMALGVGGYNKIWSPFATCICWGLSTATLLILLFIPPFYLIIEDVKRFASRLGRADRVPSGALAELADR